jgi:putative chitinase
MDIKIENLKGHVPEAVYSQIMDTVVDFELNTPLRLAHFLGQCSHESGGFNVTQEKLNYSAERLKKIFPKYFPETLSESYARQPEKIASRVYGGRMGNGDESTKEGYKFRGRGYIQLTGKNNYKSFGESIDVDVITNPDIVSSKYPLLSAAWYFNTNGLHKIADTGSTDDVVTKITKRINGGTIGVPERIVEFKKFYELLS